MGSRDERFTEFVRSSAPALRRTAYLMCGDWHQADDAVQDALYKLYIAWPRASRAGNLFGYARRSVVNAVVDGTRRPWRREKSIERLPEGALPDPTGDLAERDEVLAALGAIGARQRPAGCRRTPRGSTRSRRTAALSTSRSSTAGTRSRGVTASREGCDLCAGRFTTPVERS